MIKQSMVGFAKFGFYIGLMETPLEAVLVERTDSG